MTRRTVAGRAMTGRNMTGRTMVVAVALSVASALAGCVSPEDAAAPPPDPSVLMDADLAFSDAVAEGGSAAWAAWFTEDGAMIREGVGEIRGREAVQAAVAALDNPGVSLTWEPSRAEISGSGDLGWTTGTYVSRATAPDGTEVEGTGWYVSIWRLQSDGSWKVVMDLGHPRERPEG